MPKAVSFCPPSSLVETVLTFGVLSPGFLDKSNRLRLEVSNWLSLMPLTNAGTVASGDLQRGTNLSGTKKKTGANAMIHGSGT